MGQLIFFSASPNSFGGSRVISPTTALSRRARIQKPSCLISRIQPGPEGGAFARRQTRRSDGIKLRGNNLKLPMSALGRKRTSEHVRVMSALPPKADIVVA